jgi:hypothetical protein
MDEHHLGLGFPSDQTTEPTGGDVTLAFFMLAERRRELLVLDELAFREQMRVTGKLDCHVQQANGPTIFMASGVGSKLSTISHKLRLEFGLNVFAHARPSTVR